ILSADIARRTWPGEDPIGKRVRFGSPDGDWATVVGIVGTTRYRELRTARPTMYLSAPQIGVGTRLVVLRTSRPPGELLFPVRDAVRAMDAEAHVLQLTTMNDLLAEPLSRPRFQTVLLAGFGIVALALAAIGIYGVLAAYVRARTREIGIRMALGALPRDVRKMIVGEGMKLALIGAGIGLAGALVATRLLRSVLFGVSPTDPLTLLATAAVHLLVALIACWLPARRAGQVDPVRTLATE
ncbi:MAG: FtsX-like permease family protein, partial [Longimicrobiales bacterium]